MAHLPTENRGSFGSKFGVIAATAGSAIGLGNIWRFPYVAGENGGGAFMLIYLGFILLIGLPVMISELSIGRATNRNAFGAFKLLRPNKPWYVVGLMGILAAITIFAFYNVVAGWTLEYLFISAQNKFQGKTAADIKSIFDQFQATGWQPIIWSFLFMALSAGVVMAGVEKGIEKYTKLLMPLLFILIIVLCVRSITLPGGKAGIDFLFKPDFSKINTNTVLEALGQAFFSLSIGMGTLITYGSYIKKNDNLGSSAVSVAIADTLIAVLAGVAIFPAVFAFGISPAVGPELVFVTLPNIFIQMPAGYIFSIMFFFLLVVAALTSSISILEVVVAFLSEELKIHRIKATIIASSFIMIMSVLCSLSLVKVPELSLFGLNMFDLFDKFSANILLPLGGFFIVLFVAWFFGTKKLLKEISSNGRFNIWYYKPFIFIVRYLAPVAIALVFANGVGLI